MISRPWGSSSTIRVRLTAALALALLPVLLLGILQSAVAFNRENMALKTEMTAAAERSGAAARARLEGAEILLQTLAPGSVGFQCAQRLQQVIDRVPGYANLIRFDREGRVACAAGGAPADPQRQTRTWFQRLASGESVEVLRESGVAYAGEPSVLAAIRATTPAGGFDGAFAAIIPLSSLQPSNKDPTLPSGAEVALADSSGHFVNATQPSAFGPAPKDWRRRTAQEGSLVWYGRDGRGERRVYAAAPVIGDDVYVLLAARSPGLLSWARFNPLLGIFFPLLTFGLAFTAVVVATDRVVLRWITYLQRIASLYARGRLSVRPVHAAEMPPEIRELATALEEMAAGIVGRDASLRDSLAQKDALMREIHHRVKNNLQVISSLLSMQQRALSDPAARAAMSDTRQRITALALIYRALYQGPDLRQVDLRPFLEELTAQLVAGGALHGPGVQTELSVDELVIDPDRLAPLALFAVEAITNAQKHAFARRGGTLSVSFHVQGDDATLEISDDGEASEGALGGAGVGRTLMNAFARQLRGRVEVVRNTKGGVTARLLFPTPAFDPNASASQDGNQAAA